MAFDADARRAELQAIYDEGDGSNWAPIRTIAEGLGITKPDDGWEAAINLIVDAEKSAVDAEPEAPDQATNGQATDSQDTQSEAPDQATDSKDTTKPEASDQTVPDSKNTEPNQTPTQPPPEITPWRKARTDLYGKIIPNPWHS
ncbi:hypothetical protein N836_28885 [Leptolyngbya sp. Heron Island J]|uniref:hypothetical protein n=1 Tax=Leptolyngbya sp. Heron Island J TaxID=1385935 RepID=UPI0003B9C20B|nr:hypothetical protein [Leptolyngbya sp. Heron Island J]ESA39094.1 hypothetical protein N836_28885 [Leptolyngbya sp. Heron Island J]